MATVGAVRGQGMRPEHAAGRRIVTGDARLVEHDDLPHAGERRQHGRAVAGKVVAGAPCGLSRIAMIGHERSARRPSGADDDEIVDDEGRTAPAPVGLRRVVVGGDVASPDRLARLQIEAVEQSGRPEREDAPARDGWRRAWALAGNRGLVVRLVSVRPLGGAVREAIGHDHLAAAALLLRDRHASSHGEPRPSRPDRPPPHLFRRPRGPIIRDPQTRDRAVTCRAEELRVVAGDNCLRRHLAGGRRSFGPRRGLGRNRRGRHGREPVLPRSAPAEAAADPTAAPAARATPIAIRGQERGRRSRRGFWSWRR